ncbi:hypothetical protein MXB02_14260 [Pseudomonas mosselii]|uniref:hypothetical protein n=1 Tax=Pseudomonas mosselii TaxID=78327 RepID=UPI001FF86D30|nr:hypothetical protein [Pseudomonas mosselii]UPF01762.1 hypothetical protein MXB02_14260 [Pseudomonas mosselii]
MARPVPSDDLLESPWLTICPAAGVWSWVQSEILADTGSIYNPGNGLASEDFTWIALQGITLQTHP